MAISVRTLREAPDYALGFQVTEALKTGVYLVKSDAVNYNEPSGSVVFSVPPNTFIAEVYAQVITTWNGTSPSVSLGVTGDTGRHMTLSSGNLGTAGYYRSAQPPRGYTSATDLIVTISGTGVTQGSVVFYILFRPNTELPHRSY